MKKIVLGFVFAALLLTACSAQAVNPTVNSSQNDAQENQAVEENVEVSPDMNTEEDRQPVEEEVVEPTATPEPVDDAVAGVSFANDVLPILENRCLNCHGGDRIEGGLTIRSYADLIAGGESGSVVIPGDAEGSLLYQLVSSGEMPKRGANLTPVQLEVLMQWINGGVLDN